MMQYQGNFLVLFYVEIMAYLDADMQIQKKCDK